jgi:SAM-dependent methyltransferase
MMDQHEDDGGRVGFDAERVRLEYERRDRDERLNRYYQRIGPAVERAVAERRTRVWAILTALGPPDGLRILDVGCGAGRDLIWLADQGIPPTQLFGIDLHSPAVATASEALPGATVVVGNGADLPFADGSVDVAMQTVALSSVVEPEARRRVAREMGRVVRPGGRIISYDMIAAPSSNEHLVGIDRSEVDRLFADLGDLQAERITLAMPIASRLPTVIADRLNIATWLRSHLLVVVRVPE